MLKYKVNYYKKKIFSLINRKFGWIATSFKPDTILVVVIFVFISLFLVQSIYRSIGDLNKYELLEQEEKRLEELKQEQERLTQELKYYSSPIYVKEFAKDSLNLAEKGTKVYVVERDVTKFLHPEVTDYEKIQQDNYALWWIRLIL